MNPAEPHRTLTVIYRDGSETIRIPCDPYFVDLGSFRMIPFQTRYSLRREVEITRAQNKTLQIKVKFEDGCYLAIKGRLVVIGADNDILNFGIVAEKPPIFHLPRYAGDGKYRESDLI